jgi:hypothetical protein
MPGVFCQRHPRYVFFVALIILTTVYLLNSNQVPPALVTLRGPANVYDTTLPARVVRAENIYDRVLRGRQSLIKRFGPTPHDIAM